MRILFVYPNVRTGHPNHVPPGIASMSAVLKQAGHETAIIDLSQEMESEEFTARVKAYDPELVGFSATTNQWHFASHYARLVREVTKAPTVCRGYHPTLVPEETIEDPCMDWTIRGEGEEPLFNLVYALEHGQSPDNIANLWGGPNKVRNPLRPPIPDLDVLPLLDWDIFDNETVLRQSGGTVELCLGRGCPKDCTYCCNPQWKELYRGKGSVVRKFSVPRALAEIKHSISKLHPQAFLFYDEVFTIKKEWVKDFCTQYKEQIGIPFHVQLRVDMVDDEMLEMLKNAGCISVLTGVEVGDESYRRKFLNRMISDDDIRRFYRKADELGICTFAFVMFGLPKETPKQIRKTIRFAKELHLDHVQSTIYYPFPKTALYDLAAKEGYLTGEQYPSAMTEKSLLKQPQISEKLLRESMYKISRISLRGKIDKQQIGLYDFVSNLKRARKKAGHPEYIQITVFGEYLGEVVTLVAHPPSSISYRLTIPEQAVLRTAAGLNPEVWNKREGDAVRFIITLKDRDATHELVSKTINPKFNIEDQGWYPIEIPLAQWAGQKVTISFVTQADPADNSYSWAGWARPHIARENDPKPRYFRFTGLGSSK